MLFWKKNKSPIEKYKRVREAARALTKPIMDTMPEFVLPRAARDLDMGGHGKVLMFDSEDEMAFLMDRCFYDIYWEANNLVGHFIESDAFKRLSEDEQRIAQGMTTAYYSLFEILIADPDEATLDLADLLGAKNFTISDVNLSLTAVEGNLLAMRINQIEGLFMGTGAACPFYANQKDRLLDGLKSRRPLAGTGKKKNKPRKLERSDYSAYFFKQHKRMGGIGYSTSEELEYPPVG